MEVPPNGVGRRLVGGAFDRQFGADVVGTCANGRRRDILEATGHPSVIRRGTRTSEGIRAFNMATRARTQTRETWLTAALEQLREHGSGGLAIDKIARRLGVTRGSFYHHFDNLEAFIEELPTHWMYRFAPTPFEVIVEWEPTVEGWVRKLVCDYIPNMGRMRYDAAMRAWAETDEAALRAVCEVDGARLEMLRRFFSHFGCGDCAEPSAIIAYSMIIGVDGVCRWGQEERDLIAEHIIAIQQSCRTPD
jgi:AcrR family transcriptional regulator